LFACPVPLAAQDKGETCLQIAAYSDVRGAFEIADAISIAYQRIGQCTTILEMPVARADQLLLAGRIDGNILRTQYYIRANRNAVIGVPTSVMEIRIVALSRSDDPAPVRTTSDLGGRKVGVMQGVHIAEQMAAKASAERIDVEEMDQLYRLLMRGRIDVALLDHFSLMFAVDRSIFDQDRLNVSAPLTSFTLHHVVHKRHMALVPALENEIAALANAGAFLSALRSAGTPSDAPYGRQ